MSKIGVLSAKSKILSAIAAALMDGPPTLRRYMFDTFVVEGFTFHQVMSDDDALEGQRLACGTPRAHAAWDGRAIRWRLSIPKAASEGTGLARG